jgi:hypothetical protein
MARKKHVDGAAPEPANDERELTAAELGSERAWQATLRPRTFDDYIGQRDLIENLRVSVRAAREQRLAARSLPVRRPARPGQDHARQRDRQRAGREPGGVERPCDRSQGHAGVAPDLARRARRAVHRRDPPAVADRRGEPLPGDGGLQVRSVHRRWPPRQGRDHAAAAVHAARRHHADGPALGAAARSLRLPLAAPLLRPRGHDRDRPALGAADRACRSTTPARSRSRSRARGTPRIANRLLRRVRDFAAVEGDGSIDGRRSPPSRSIASRSITPASTRSIARTCRWCASASTAARSASRRSPRRCPRSAAPSRRSSSRSCCRSASSRARRAAASPPPRATSHMGLAAPAKAPSGGTGSAQGRLF